VIVAKHYFFFCKRDSYTKTLQKDNPSTEKQKERKIKGRTTQTRDWQVASNQMQSQSRDCSRFDSVADCEMRV